jgi:hypothetical protein
LTKLLLDCLARRLLCQHTNRNPLAHLASLAILAIVM